MRGNLRDLHHVYYSHAFNRLLGWEINDNLSKAELEELLLELKNNCVKFGSDYIDPAHGVIETLDLGKNYEDI